MSDSARRDGGGDALAAQQRAPGVLALHHVQLGIPRGGEVRCREFWAGVLGMTEVAKPPALVSRGGCWFRHERLEVHLGVEEPFQAARKAHPGVLVGDVNALAQQLQEAGYPVAWDGDFPGYDRFYSADPFGNRLEFLQPRPWDG